MDPARAFYSIVQYVPDGGRAEAANAGVVLFVPSRRILEVRVSPTLERVKTFFKPGRHERRRIELALEAFKYRMELARSEFTSEADLAQFAAARADAIRLTPPKVVMVQEAVEEINTLYRELVGDAERRPVGEGEEAPLPTELAEVFGRLELERKIWRPGSITVPTLGKRFEVAAAYENGRVNFVRSESLAPRPRMDMRLAKLGFNGRLIFQHPVENKPSQLVVLSTDSSADVATEARFQSALRDFDVRFIPHERLDEFAQEVERTAH